MKYTTILGSTLAAALLTMKHGVSAVSPFDQDDLNRAKSVWEAQNTGFYDFVYARYDLFLEEISNFPWKIEVRNGKAISASVNKTVLVNSNVPLPTVDDLFDLVIQDAINRSAPLLFTIYNKEYGYPETIVLGYNTDVQGNEILITVSDYVQVPYEPDTGELNVENNETMNLDLQELIAAHELWDIFYQTHPEYRFSYERICDGCHLQSFPWKVWVQQNVAMEVKDSNGLLVEDSWGVLTIEKIFSDIEDAILDGAEDVDVEYDPSHGYPTSAIIPSTAYHVEVALI